MWWWTGAFVVRAVRVVCVVRVVLCLPVRRDIRDGLVRVVERVV